MEPMALLPHDMQKHLLSFNYSLESSNFGQFPPKCKILWFPNSLRFQFAVHFTTRLSALLAFSQQTIQPANQLPASRRCLPLKNNASCLVNTFKAVDRKWQVVIILLLGCKISLLLKFITYHTANFNSKMP